MIWWEKTVEYKFIADMVGRGQQFLAPLDGHHERAGDALLAIADGWILLEFKKDVDSINQELTKFERYSEAHAALCEADGHHLFVYGDLNEGLLELSAMTYFSDQRFDIYSISAQGVGFDYFKAYLEAFVGYKKPIKRGGGGGRMAASDYMTVAGISSSGEVVQCLSLHEFNTLFGLGLELTQKPTLDLEPGPGL